MVVIDEVNAEREGRRGKLPRRLRPHTKSERGLCIHQVRIRQHWAARELLQYPALHPVQSVAVYAANLARDTVIHGSKSRSPSQYGFGIFIGPYGWLHSCCSNHPVQSSTLVEAIRQTPATLPNRNNLRCPQTGSHRHVHTRHGRGDSSRRPSMAGQSAKQ